jgi:hypothetical protein
MMALPTHERTEGSRVSTGMLHAPCSSCLQGPADIALTSLLTRAKAPLSITECTVLDLRSDL